ncbi:ROK family protein [Mycolicibacterium mengxianglii]|uniref:ROK family protein n=1 Tax=Mycolicibacterium mengxianglii TaxID=2736649 RepID=UPI0018EED064|nr:ROK family protein [Mycolicibacterium mengxianglii]
MADLTLALDIGGTKIAAGLVDDDGRLFATSTTPTPRGDAEAVWQAVERMLKATAAEADVRGIGVAAAGPIDIHAGTVSPINIAGWSDFPLRDRLVAVAPDVPVRIGGDGVCMALGEHWRGAGQGAPSMMGMVISTGVGGGLVLDGKPYVGRTGNAGHVGHVVVEPGGPQCSCGARGCVEAIAAGPRMVQWARELGWDAPAEAGGPELAAAARGGDRLAQRAFERSADAVAAMVASVGAVCDLDLVVIGGGVANAGAVLFEPLRASLAGYARLDFLTGMQVVPAALGADAGLVGAAALLRD